MTLTINGKTTTINPNVGVQGLSAYQVAVKNGFVGTEQDWLSSLNGTGGGGSGSGDMLTTTYDTNTSGVVDNAEKVNGLTVETAVPLNAIFTDTVYDDTAVQSKADANTTKLASIESGATADQTASEIKSAYESNLNTNALTDTLLTLLNLKKVKDVTTDAVNNWLVITYTDNTSANLTISDIVADIHVSGASLNASTNVLTLSSTNGGANVTVDLSDFVNSSELTSALSTKQDVLLEGAFVNGDKTKLNNIPSNADNTATNETSHANVLVDSDTVSPVTPSNKLLTQSDAVVGGQVNSVVAGTNVTVDNTDPANPIVSSSGGGGAFEPFSLSGGGMHMNIGGSNILYCNTYNNYIYAHVAGNSNFGFMKFDKLGNLISRYAMDTNSTAHSFCFAGNYIYSINFGWTKTGNIVKLNPVDMSEVSTLHHSFYINDRSEYSGIFSTATNVLFWYENKVYDVNKTSLSLTELTAYQGVQYVVETGYNTICIIDSTSGHLLNDDLTPNTTKTLPVGYEIIVQAEYKYGNSFLYLVRSDRYITTFNITNTNGGGSLLLPNNGTRVYTMNLLFNQTWDYSNFYCNGYLIRSKGASATIGTVNTNLPLQVEFTRPPYNTAKFFAGTTRKDTLWV